jgi:hypothetical protein
MGIAALHSSRALVVLLPDANRARIEIQLSAACHALLGSEHCSRTPLSHEIES